ncbi:1-acyl-sn-glycerol-3-phosphate acyltransferase [Pelagibius litoralis]|uniref:1-acyl-sn-glycerol-3-phosphate acyltransferase n=1 Tax=Pelagibius litoralis TaxID=374515 RepID=A0A967F2Z9_9PROT|nr:lysophospholipid acyltransferase family protein [Pelagibius litoralis]NIA72155.1 1-acyl-sn-glycerol-3-phosphate acyltransferase [Pelagibius litoralis]
MTAPNFGSPLTAAGRFVVYFAFTAVLMPVQLLAVGFRWPLRKTLPHWYHRRSCRILGIRIKTRGKRSRSHPTLFVANHVSYFDIEVLGALAKISFVAKAEVATWPFFSWLARLQETVFVERKVQRTADHRDEIARRLEAGDDLVLFAEGTSGDGNGILPFKSALFSVAERRPRGEPLVVQPVSISYTRLDGVPLGRYLRPFFAWYGDMELGPHLWHALKLGYVTVVVEFHETVTIDRFGSRKGLCDHCHATVSRGVAAALSGRRQPGPALPQPG